MKTVVLAVLAGALATPALAEDPAAQLASKAKKPHLICKRDGSTGSHLSTTICKTAAEWTRTTVESDRNKLDTVTHD